jgi:hypothetical protein
MSTVFCKIVEINSMRLSRFSIECIPTWLKGILALLFDTQIQISTEKFRTKRIYWWRTEWSVTTSLLLDFALKIWPNLNARPLLWMPRYPWDILSHYNSFFCCRSTRYYIREDWLFILFQDPSWFLLVKINFLFCFSTFIELVYFIKSNSKQADEK